MFVLPGGNTDDPTPPVTSANPGSGQDATVTTITHATQGVAFEVSADRTQAEGTDLFYIASGKQVYGLNGVSALVSYTPQEVYRAAGTSAGTVQLYIGFYLPELEMADLTNCNAMSHAQWTFQEKTA